MSSAESFGVDVSRETFSDLEALRDIVLKWNRTINLVSRSSLTDIWKRHIWDSAQLIDFVPQVGKWVDIGSGGGFPGLVVGILVKHLKRDCPVVLVESDRRKAAFLREATRELSLDIEVLSERVETVEPLEASVLSARALADLSVLLSYADRHLHSGGTALFLKGETWKHEVELARESWSFDLQTHESKTNPSAAILEIKEVERV